MALRGWLLCVLAVFVCAFPGPAQSTNAKDLATGKFLVASHGLLDPNFMETVVLLVEYQESGVVGLVVNRRTRLPVSRALSVQEAKGRAEPVFIGGPVEVTGVMALARSTADVEGAKRVLGDVYLITTKTLLDKSLASPIAASAFHVFLGYAGWSAPQLRHELELGGWYIFPGDAGDVFDADPGSVWNRLIVKAPPPPPPPQKTRIAMFNQPPYAPR